MWTIERVKSELPNIQICYGKKTYTGKISGRLCPFATVWFWFSATAEVSFEFSWETLARCLNENVPVRA